MINNKTQRYYWLDIKQDLFDNWYLLKIFGGLYNHRQQKILIYFNSKLEASQAMFDVECLRLKRGYVYVDTHNSEDYILTPEIAD